MPEPVDRTPAQPETEQPYEPPKAEEVAGEDRATTAAWLQTKGGGPRR